MKIFFCSGVVFFQHKCIFALALKGRLAQLVQSAWFTPRRPGVRVSHRPQKKRKISEGVFLFLVLFLPLLIEILGRVGSERPDFRSGRPGVRVARSSQKKRKIYF